MNTNDFFDIFQKQIAYYHIADSIDAPSANPYPEHSFEYLLWQKSWIDTVQWHLEDLIRPEDVDPVEALKLKRRIDRSNQNRTDMVEQMDDYYYAQFHGKERPDASLNTETPAWAIDRLSILALKIYHFSIEAHRTDTDDAHRSKCQAKLDTLMVQKTDLMSAIDQLLLDLSEGRKRMCLYRQMKMYNDPSLNPSLYAGKK